MRFEELRESLLRAGIAPRHVRNYLTELREHLADLSEKERTAGYDAKDAAIRARAALGSDDDLYKAMLDRRGLRSFTARAPWAVFGLLPPLAVIAGFMIPILLLIFIVKITGSFRAVGLLHQNGFAL